jgi:hypothetical protein
MTEREWLAGTDPKRMLAYLRGKASDRKLRLFAVACCRHIWHLLPEGPGRDAVVTGERFAEGLVDRRQVGTARRKVAATFSSASAGRPGAFDASRDEGEAAFAAVRALEAAQAALGKRPSAPSECSICAAHACGTDAARAGSPATYDDPDTYGASELEGRHREYLDQSGLLRDLFGNPFRPVTLSRSWRTPGVVKLAQAAYDNRTLPSGTLDPDRLALLADALEDAGCDNADLLGHLRGEGPHVRGCWAVDLCLGRE